MSGGMESGVAVTAVFAARREKLTNRIFRYDERLD
jgi:uncharacterized protein YoaH (UPF0181 family)